LERAINVYGHPQMLCVDNGPEFSGRVLDQWAQSAFFETRQAH
jgi:hypothetical protein